MLTGDGATPKFITIMDPSQWQARITTDLSPPQPFVLVNGKCHELLLEHQSMHLQVHPVKMLLEVAAEAAFWDLDVTILTKMYKTLEKEVNMDSEILSSTIIAYLYFPQHSNIML